MLVFSLTSSYICPYKLKMVFMKRLFIFFGLCLLELALYAASSVRIGVLLPLKEKTERGTTFIEFYQGLLMAVEQAKEKGINVDVYAADCGASETQLQEVLKNPALQEMDVIFGPADAVQVTSLSEYCRQHRIRMVLPFNTPCPQVYSNPWIYQVGVIQELLYPAITKLVLDNLENSNFILCHSGEADARGSSFVEHIKQVLSLHNMQTTTLAANADEFAFDRAFNQFRRNVVLLDSRSNTAINRLLVNLKAYQQKYPQYKISLLGYPEWLTYTKEHLQDFYLFDTYVYSPYFRNPLSGRVAKFEQNYQQNFGSAMRNTFPRAGMLGYDLGNYFLQGIATWGDDFDNQQGALEQRPLQHGFRFQRVGEQGGFVNLYALLLHYTTNKTIQVLK